MRSKTKRLKKNICLQTVNGVANCHRLSSTGNHSEASTIQVPSTERYWTVMCLDNRADSKNERTSYICFSSGIFQFRGQPRD